jgi:addiction module RelE/StbE family toxin
MVDKKPWVIIDNEAKKALHEAFIYIRKDSLQNAEKVKNKILATIKELPENPKKHNPDKYRIKNDNNSFRAYEIYKYRVTYHVSTEEIRVIRIRHTKMNPIEY